MIRMRWFVLTVLSVLGAVLFLPFLKAVGAGGISLGRKASSRSFVDGAFCLVYLAGLRFADQAGFAHAATTGE